jgi:hypothetical protein
MLEKLISNTTSTGTTLQTVMNSAIQMEDMSFRSFLNIIHFMKSFKQQYQACLYLLVRVKAYVNIFIKYLNAT